MIENSRRINKWVSEGCIWEEQGIGWWTVWTRGERQKGSSTGQGGTVLILLPSDVKVKATILITICKASPGLELFSPQPHFLLLSLSLSLLQLWLITSYSFQPQDLCFCWSFHQESAPCALLLVLFFLSSCVIYLRKLFPESSLPFPIHSHKIGSTQLHDLIELYFPIIALKTSYNQIFISVIVYWLSSSLGSKLHGNEDYVWLVHCYISVNVTMLSKYMLNEWLQINDKNYIYKLCICNSNSLLIKHSFMCQKSLMACTLTSF